MLGCVTVRGGSRGAVRPISIAQHRGSNVVIQAGVAAIDDTFTFESFAANMFVDTEVGIHVAPLTVKSIAGTQTYSGVLREPESRAAR